jgi:thiol-disulfide isomerase/thioredoxin
MKIDLDRSLTLVLIAAAIVVAGSSARRSFLPPARPVPLPRYEFHRNWERLPELGIRTGIEDARVRIVIFSDFECPSCAMFHPVLTQLLQKYPETVSTHYIHYPLSYHKFALPAARASNCAAEEGRFDQWADILFRKQDSLGIKSWGAFAFESGITDTLRIAQCAGLSAIRFR